MNNNPCQADDGIHFGHSHPRAAKGARSLKGYRRNLAADFIHLEVRVISMIHLRGGVHADLVFSPWLNLFYRLGS
jgi:hypothetical protein